MSRCNPIRSAICAVLCLLAIVAAPLANATNYPISTFPSYGSAVMGGIDGFANGDGYFSVDQTTGQYRCFPSCFATLTQPPVVAEGALGVSTNTLSSAYAFADLATGNLSVKASGTYFNGGFFGAGAASLIWDTYTFSGAAPGATATITMTGTDGLSVNGRISAGSGAFFQTDVSNPQLTSYLNAFNLINAPIDPTYSFQSTFGIENNVPTILFATVSVASTVCGVICPGGSESFITDPISLDLPVGVTFTTASGGTFSPVAGVPEPETYAMLLTGLGLLGFTARRRKQK